MPQSYKSSGAVRKTHVRAKAARAATSMMRQAGYSARRAAFTANSLVRLGGRMPASSTELKDITLNSTAIIAAANNVATVFLINGVAQGTTATTRLGRRIVMKSLLVNFQASLAATSAGSATIRLLCVYDCQTNATAPAATDVLLSDAVTSPMNLSNSRRFKTLFDEVIPCIGTAGPQSVDIKRYIKMNMNTEFNTGSAGTVGDIQTGSVYVLAYCAGALITASPTHSFYSRIRFQDN